MKKSSTLFSLLLLILFACNSPQKQANSVANIDEQTEETSDVESSKSPKDQLLEFNEYLKKFDNTSQYFKLSSSKIGTIIGKKGTVIHVNPTNLETIDGSPLAGEIQIELKELTQKKDLILSSTQTISNGQIIETGGAYYIHMTSGGKKLKLKENKKLDIEFPNISAKSMELFYGEKNELNEINWEPINTKLVPKPITENFTITQHDRDSDIESIFKYLSEDSVPISRKTTMISNSERQKRKEESKNRKEANTIKYYDITAVQQLDWINVDRFIDNPNPVTMNVLYDSNDNIEFARIYLIMKDINSVLIESYYKNEENQKTIFKNIPNNKSFRVLVITKIDKQNYIFDEDLKASKDLNIHVKLKAVTEEELEMALKK